MQGFRYFHFTRSDGTQMESSDWDDVLLDAHMECKKSGQPLHVYGTTVYGMKAHVLTVIPRGE